MINKNKENGLETPKLNTSPVSKVTQTMQDLIQGQLIQNMEKEMDPLIIEEKFESQVANCKSQSDFLFLFQLHKVPGCKWRTSTYFRHALSGLFQAILRDRRFGSWDNFLKFMEPETGWPIDESLLEFSTAKQIAACTTPQQFILLFALYGIHDNNWISTGYLEKKNLSNFCRYITKDPRFGSWDTFLKFMEPVKKVKINHDILSLSYTKQINACKNAEDFLQLFKLHNIIDFWENTQTLKVKGFTGLMAAVGNDSRFGKWSRLVDFINDDNYEIGQELELLSLLKLEEAAALFQDDSLKFKRYIEFAHSELSEAKIDALVLRTFKGLRNKGDSSEKKYFAWKEGLQSVAIEKEPEEETEENTITINGTTTGATHIFVAGTYTRRKKVEQDGSFEITVPLKTGETNSIRIMCIDVDGNIRSAQEEFAVQQLSEPDDIDALVRLLSGLGKEVRSGIQKDAGRMKYLCECLEQSLIKKFGRSFSEGKKYIEGLMQKESTSAMMKKVLQIVLNKFQEIHDAEIPGVIDGSLLFFQKYCAFEIRRRMEQGLRGVILANDPGTGKTRVVQSATADKNTTVITPNSVVSAWEEESGRVLENTDVVALRDLHSDVRKNILRTRKSTRDALTPHHTYVNREFLRNTKDDERFELLSDKKTIVVHDEAHSRTNENSEQSKGAKKLDSQFQILVSATPFKNPETFRRMMAILKPDDARFKSNLAFSKAFPSSDPQALKTLSLIKNDVTLRFRKEDVMETVDPNQSLEQQKNRLPIKEFVDQRKHGQFTMSMAQAESLYQIFVNWKQWCKENNEYIPKDETAKEDGLRTSDGFAKTHAFRQTVNNPAYVGAKGPDHKLEEMKTIVAECLKEGRKIVIFCVYQAQAEKYAEAFAALEPALYIGLTSKKGDVKNENGKPKKFKKGDTGNGQHGWIFDKKGYPIEDANGEPMSTLDYERITFQNVASRKLLISTYSAGAVGTTFTAGKALVEDDLPSDCIEEIQAEDRIHRIDPSRMTHATVKYYRMISAYPPKFLEDTKKRWLVKENGNYEEFESKKAAEQYALAHSDADHQLKAETAYDLFFAQGTYDQVHEKNLEVQRTMFRLINDGIAEESILEEDQISFKGLSNGVNGKK